VRILHVLDHSAPLASGYAYRTLAILAEQRRRGWSTCQLTSARQGPTSEAIEQAAGFEFHRTQSDGPWHERLPLVREWSLGRRLETRLSALARAFRPDVIHAHSPVLTLLPALRVGRAARIPVVYEVRSLWEESAIEKGKVREGSARHRASRALETWALRRSDHVIVICEGLQRELVGRGLPADRITVVGNGVDIERYPMGASRDPGLERELGLEGCRVVGFAGSFHLYEGLDLLVEAFAQESARRPDLRLLLIGSGAEDARLRRLASRPELAGRIVFAGLVPNERMRAYYSLIDLAVYPRRASRLTHTVTPLKPLEAMAQGIAVVASDIGGHRELVVDGATGYLAPPDDATALAAAMARALDDDAERHVIVANARRFVETRRTWRATVARTAIAYEKAGVPAEIIGAGGMTLQPG
jgi:glycogen(starch) synthase